MTNYSKTKIYRIPVGDEWYVGHTTMRLSKRKYNHKWDFEHKPNRLLYRTMRELGMTANDITLELIEEYPCATSDEAHLRERMYIERYGTLNKNIPSRSKKEYWEVFKEKYNRRVKCPHCDTNMMPRNIKKHVNLKHPNCQAQIQNQSSC